MSDKPTPTLKQLSYFSALAETQNYRKAAEKVGISQPSLSLQISNLETTLSLTLVERGRAGAMLTPAGREVLRRTNAILKDVTDLLATSVQLGGGFAGTYRLGASATLGPYILPRVVQTLHKQFPALRLFISDGTPQDLLHGLLSGQHDMILTQLPVHTSDVVVQRLFREPLHLVVARDHRLAGKRKVSDTDLAGENVLSLSARFTLHQQIADITSEVGATLMQDYEGTSLDAIRQMVAMNMGVSFLPSLYIASEITEPDGDVAVIPFRPGRFSRSIGLVWRSSAGRIPSFHEFGTIIRNVTQERFKGLVQMES